MKKYALPLITQRTTEPWSEHTRLSSAICDAFATRKQTIGTNICLSLALRTILRTPTSVTKYTPYEVLFGRIANLPGKLQQVPQPLYNFDDVMNIKNKMQGCQHSAREKLIKFKEKQKERVKSNEWEFKDNDWF